MAINRLIDSSFDRDGKNGVTEETGTPRDETPGGGVEFFRVVRARANFIKEREKGRKKAG